MNPKYSKGIPECFREKAIEMARVGMPAGTPDDISRPDYCSWVSQKPTVITSKDKEHFDIGISIP